MRRATVLILPLKSQFSLFGTETLVAMAAGVPVLVSRNSGIASFLHRTGLIESIVWDNEGFEKDVDNWKTRLIEYITNPKETLNIAKELRKMLLLNTNIASTHFNFGRTITGWYYFCRYVSVHQLVLSFMLVKC